MAKFPPPPNPMLYNDFLWAGHSLKSAPSSGEMDPPSNTRVLGPTQIHNPLGMHCMVPSATAESEFNQNSS